MKDYTRCRAVGSLAVCPGCNRIGLQVPYTLGGTLYVHTHDGERPVQRCLVGTAGRLLSRDGVPQ